MKVGGGKERKNVMSVDGVEECSEQKKNEWERITVTQWTSERERKPETKKMKTFEHIVAAASQFSILFHFSFPLFLLLGHVSLVSVEYPIKRTAETHNLDTRINNLYRPIVNSFLQSTK